jgi:cyclohexa-1,5-dienecarbonyl-CoA hydratase
MNGAVAVTATADGSRTSLRFSHPTGNIITGDIVAALDRAIGDAGANTHLKLITIEAEGPDFSFGASIPEHVPHAIGNVLPRMHRLIERLLEAPAVTAAVVRGRCLGGGFELALACDFIFAAEDATFGLPEVALGVFPPAAAALLPLRTNGAVATRAILTGESRGALDWHRNGLVGSVVPASSLAAAVDAWFEKHLAPKSAAALRHAASAARCSLLTQIRRTLPDLERLYLHHLMRTHDAAEGVAAFLEKRPPRWTDS